MNEMYLNYFKLFGLEKYRDAFLHSRPSSGSVQNSSNEPELWKQTEDMTRNVLKRRRHQLRRGA